MLFHFQFNLSICIFHQSPTLYAISKFHEKWTLSKWFETGKCEWFVYNWIIQRALRTILKKRSRGEVNAKWLNSVYLRILSTCTFNDRHARCFQFIKYTFLFWKFEKFCHVAKEWWNRIGCWNSSGKFCHRKRVQHSEPDWPNRMVKS